MAHIALYRSYRPQSFGDVVGQKHIIRTLQNSLKEQRLSHAYLFCGPRGTGKTSAAKILAKAVNCENGPSLEPCNACAACERIKAGAVMDVLEIDAASNRGVEEIRDIRDKVKYAPTEVRHKVYIIDEVHMLTTEAFNALLKTLEEPPAHVMFILATTEPHKLPATIISRCQRFDFRRVSLEEQIERIRHICEQEGITADDDAIDYIARLSDGGMRDALSLLDQIVSFTGNHVTYRQVLDMTGGIASEQFGRLAEAIRAGDIGALLSQIDGMMQEGKSADKCIENLIYYYRDLLMIKMIPNAQGMTDRLTNVDAFREMADKYSREQIFQIIDILNHYQTEMKYASQPQTLFEVAMMKICSLPAFGGSIPASMGSAAPHVAASSDPATAGSEDARQLARKVEALEKRLEELLRQGVPAGGTSSNDPARGAYSRPAATTPRTGSVTPSLAKSPGKLEPFLQGKSSPAFQQLFGQWGRVMQRVKEEKVSIHAWLNDGKLVSQADDMMLVAFKNTIHRETTEKAANKQLIERMMQEVYGKPLRLVTMMLKDWEEADSGAAAAAPKEELQLEPEDGLAEKPQEEWIGEAIKLFGEDLVVIKES